MLNRLFYPVPDPKLTRVCDARRCLKQYCECYRAGDSCECVNCANDASHEDLRARSMNETRKISTYAFAPGAPPISTFFRVVYTVLCQREAQRPYALFR